MFGGNGGLLECTVGNPKYLRGPNGSKLPPLWSDGWFTKTLFTFPRISSCKFKNYVPLGMCGLDLIPTIISSSANANKISIIVIIK